MARFIEYDRHQQYLLPPSVDEWLPEDQLARYIVEVIDQLDLSKLTSRYSRSGSEAYHPALMLATGLRLCHRHLLQSQNRTGDA